jgi:mycoredoxin
MLTVYATSWCPHCRKSVDFLMKHHIDFIYKDIERQPDEIVKRVIEANGGKDWVVPTMEFKDKWRPGKTFHAKDLEADLKAMGVIS